MPRSALASLPVMSHEILVGEDSFSCSKVTVPLTLESPRRTATAGVMSAADLAACSLDEPQPYPSPECWAVKGTRVGVRAIKVSQ